MLRYHLGRAALSLVRCLPPPSYTLICKVLGWCLYQASKKVAMGNLAIAFPDKGLKERKAIAKKSAVNVIAQALGVLRLGTQTASIVDDQLIQDAYQKDKGLLVASLHMGPVELVSYQLNQAGFPCSVVIGRGKKSPWLHQLGKELFTRYGFSIVPRQCPFSLLRKLREGHCMAFHCDLRARDGVEALFFGETVRAPQGVISLALLHKMPVLYHYAEPDGSNAWKLRFASLEMEHTGNYQNDLKVNVQKLMLCIENTIRAYPEHWIWCYDRFKLKRRQRSSTDIAP